MTIQVRITGVDKVLRDLAPDEMGQRLGTALQQSALIVQAAAQKKVHSPDNPFIGKAGHDVSTGRLQASLGTSDLRGAGLNQSIAVGTPYGKGGVGTFGRSARRGPRGGRGRQRGGTALTGGHRNKSDVRVYGPIEERRHPFLGVSLEANALRIRDLIRRAILGGR